MSSQGNESLTEKVIKKLQKALDTLGCIDLKDNGKPLAAINDHVDGILSNLKYFPASLSFDTLPTEIKTNILGYLCESGAFVASSVSREWRNVMESRLKKMKEVTVGKHCSNFYECEDKVCFMPEEILKASKILKSDIPLRLCYPVVDEDSDVIIEGLVAASSLIIEGNCSCVDMQDLFCGEEKQILTEAQFNKFSKALNKKSQVMKKVALVELDLRGLKQKRLMACLLNKTHSLTLSGGDLQTFPTSMLVNAKKLLKGLLKFPKDSKLKELNLFNLYLGDRNVAEDWADAFCNVYSVHLQELYLDEDMIKRLIDNILNRPITLRMIKINDIFGWDTLIEPDDLQIMIEKLFVVDLKGVFSPKQVEAVRFLPGVEASVDRIVKDFKVEFDSSRL